MGTAYLIEHLFTVVCLLESCHNDLEIARVTSFKSSKLLNSTVNSTQDNA